MSRDVLALAGVLLIGLAGWAQPKPGGEMVIAFGTDPEWLDPIKLPMTAPGQARSLADAGGTVLTHIAESLVYMGEDQEVTPLLAESWAFSEDSKILTLYLRKGVKFHDGAPFNAQAVKDNLERFRKAAFAFLLFPQVQRIEVVDEHTVRLNLDRPFAPLIAHLTWNFAAMLSPKQLAALREGDSVSEPVGTGPFRFDKWVRGSYVRVVKNPDYWGPKAYLDSVVFRFVPSDTTRLALLETGEVHAIMAVPPHSLPRMAELPGVEILNIPSVRMIYIGFNCQHAPFTNPLVRQAINYAVDKEAIVREILGGAGRVADAPISPLVFGHTAQQPYKYDPEKARQLLIAAGFPNGFKTTLHHPTGRYMMDAAVAKTVQVYLAEVGIEAQLVTMEWAAYLALTSKPVAESTVNMFMLGWGCVTLDADYGLYSLFHSSQWVPAGGARSYYKNEAVDALLDAARRIADPGSRKDLYARAISTIWYDAPWVFLYSEGLINAQRTVAKGLLHQPRGHILAHRAWLAPL